MAYKVEGELVTRFKAVRYEHFDCCYWDGSNFEEVKKFLGGAFIEKDDGPTEFAVNTGIGDVEVHRRVYTDTILMKDDLGRYYAMKPAEFQRNYQAHL